MAIKLPEMPLTVLNEINERIMWLEDEVIKSDKEIKQLSKCIQTRQATREKQLQTIHELKKFLEDMGE